MKSDWVIKTESVPKWVNDNRAMTVNGALGKTKRAGPLVKSRRSLAADLLDPGRFHDEDRGQTSG